MSGCGVLVSAAATVLFPLGFALLAAAAAFTLDEPASLVVDVTPTGAPRRTAVRALALLVPLAVGALLILAAAGRGIALPWGPTVLALAGNVLLGFAAAATGRARTGEPGAVASVSGAAILVLPGFLPSVSQGISTFPTADSTGLSSDTTWWILLPLCGAAIAASAGAGGYLASSGARNWPV